MSLQYIIDGYNIINHPLFSRAHKKSKDARFALLEFIREKHLCGSSKNKITVIFDGYSAEWVSRRHDSDIEVVFSRDTSADEKIRNMVERSANPRNIAVVSDDKGISLFVKAAGAKSKSIEEFIGKSLEEKELLKPELTYSQMHKINQELRQIWLKKP